MLETDYLSLCWCNNLYFLVSVGSDYFFPICSLLSFSTQVRTMNSFKERLSEGMPRYSNLYDYCVLIYDGRLYAPLSSAVD